jgi:ATP-dependent Clp protease adaptor protein ClpS
MSKLLETTETGPDAATASDAGARFATPWLVIVWDDPVNLMSYVSYVFRSYFGFSREKAEQLMLQVHTEGRAAVASGNREQMERHVEALHGYGLQATLMKDEL